MHTEIDSLQSICFRLISYLMSAKNILLWGASPYTHKTLDLLKSKIDRIPNALFDTTRDITNSNEKLEVPIISLSDVYSFNHDDTVIIVNAGINELYGQIIKNELFYFRILHRKSLESAFFLAENISSFNDSVECLADEESKSLFLGRYRHLLSGIMLDSTIKSQGGPYFANDLINEAPKSWLYAGLFNGKHFDRYRRMVSFNNYRIFGVEPNPKWYQFCKHRFSDDPRITLFNNLLWSEDDENIPFIDDDKNNGLSASAFASEMLGNLIHVKSKKIDSVLLNTSVELISLDVEGSELHAIDGASSVISSARPNLSICIYHSNLDFVQIPIKLNKLTSKYVHIRQHSSVPLIETVAYVVW
jgi:FkbM family methyltransferase